MAAASAPTTVWTITTCMCDRDGGDACEACVPLVFSTKKRALAALRPILLGYMLGQMELNELAEANQAFFVEQEDGEWTLRADADIEALYRMSEIEGNQDMCRWTYDLTEVTLDKESEPTADEFDELARKLLANPSAGEKRKKAETEDTPRKAAKTDA